MNIEFSFSEGQIVCIMVLVAVFEALMLTVFYRRGFVWFNSIYLRSKRPCLYWFCMAFQVVFFLVAAVTSTFLLMHVN